MAEGRERREEAALLTRADIELYNKLIGEFESERELRGKIGTLQLGVAAPVFGVGANELEVYVRMIARGAISAACGYNDAMRPTTEPRCRLPEIVGSLLLGDTHFKGVAWQRVEMRDLGEFRPLHRTLGGAIFERDKRIVLFASEVARLEAGRQVVTHHLVSCINSDPHETMEVFRVLNDRLVRFCGYIGE